jgi:hypothetical protein
VSRIIIKQPRAVSSPSKLHEYPDSVYGRVRSRLGLAIEKPKAVMNIREVWFTIARCKRGFEESNCGVDFVVLA